MGNTCSWFGLLRRCASAASQFVCFWVDDADRHVEKAHLPVSVLGFLDGDSFTNESAANVDELASPFDLAVGADLAHHRFGGIIRLWKLRWHGTRRRLVDACRGALAERLMRPLFVVQHDDGTPTGSRSTSFFIRGILGPDAWSIFMRWLRRLAERFSVAASLVGHPGDGWRFRPGCSIGRLARPGVLAPLPMLTWRCSAPWRRCCRM